MKFEKNILKKYFVKRFEKDFKKKIKKYFKKKTLKNNFLGKKNDLLFLRNISSL